MYGDSAAARKRVSQLREQGDDIRAIADRLVASSEGVPWSGRAADAMRARIKDRANHLRVAAGHHETAADSLARHVTEVDGVKESIEEISGKADSLVVEAKSRIAALDDGASATDEDTALAAFSPPPAGHKDWLTVELPGL